MDKTSYDFEKEFNLNSKRIFREWLLESIKGEETRPMFDECVEAIGKEWGVWYHLNKNLREKFKTNLWNNRDKIKNGTYDGWCTSQFKAYTYESKICFLINPKYYKIICDYNTRISVSKKTKCKGKLHKLAITCRTIL